MNGQNKWAKRQTAQLVANLLGVSKPFHQTWLFFCCRCDSGLWCCGHTQPRLCELSLWRASSSWVPWSEGELLYASVFVCFARFGLIMFLRTRYGWTLLIFKSLKLIWEATHSSVGMNYLHSAFICTTVHPRHFKIMSGGLSSTTKYRYHRYRMRKPWQSKHCH